MALDADEEILQDFLVEAGEILEQLSEQLVDLENHPDDMDLLNAIFRGFHTVKGGAGFLQLGPLVDCCHKAENVFDTLRNGKRSVNSDLMDVVLKALDWVNAMFDQVRNREEPTPADPALLDQLAVLAKPESEDESVPEQESAAPSSAEDQTADTAQSETAEGDITDEEFEQLLDAIEDEKSEGTTKASDGGAEEGGSSGVGNDEITDDEFEALLDQLHGQGRHAGAPAGGEAEQAQSDARESAAGDSGPEQPKDPSGDGDEISEDEFESLLDQLHGPGNFKGAVSGDSPGSDSGSAPEEAAASESSGPTPTPSEDKASSSSQGPVPEKGGVAESSDTKAAPEASKPAPPEKKSGSAPPREQAPAETTVRVDTSRLDDIMNMVGELVLIRNRLKRLSDELEDSRVQKTVSNLDVVTGDLQSSVMQTRMQPIKKVFGRFPRVVRDLARSLEKEVNLSMSGEDTDLDKNLVEALSDPLVHLVRNAVDHGVEMPDVREKNGKPRVGRVALSAEQEGDHIQLVIEDDGAGMDPDVLRRKAVEKGVYDQDAADRLTDSECFQLIFAPGFSTKTEISDVSGRGVGMDVVKTKINQLNGSINIDSELGRGSRIIIKVPLTLAIMPTLMVKLDEQSFALPLVNVVEIFHLDLTKKNVVDGRECIVVRDRVYPLFHIKKWLIQGGMGEPEPEDAHVVIVAVGTKRVGFVVDQLIGQEEVVIKPLGKMLQGTAGMAGATITGDGTIALILDVPSLLQSYAR